MEPLIFKVNKLTTKQLIDLISLLLL